jgi:Protein of unknown function (DUF4244)
MSGKYSHALRNAPRRWARATRVQLHVLRRELASDAGMSTAEYAVGTIAACGFAVVLYKIVTSGAVSSELQQLIERALSAKF